MASFVDLHWLVAPFAPGVPVFTAENALREAARRFFREVPTFESEDQIGLLNGVAVYDIDEPAHDLEVVSVKRVERDAYSPLLEMQSMPTVKRKGKPTHYFSDGNKTMRFYPEPEASEVVNVTYVVRPSRNATGICDTLLDECEQAIKFGALAILKAQPDTEWSNPSEVAYYNSLFQQAVNERRVQILSESLNPNFDETVRRFL